MTNLPLDIFAKRIDHLNSVLQQNKWDAFYVPHGDVHQNEYLPETAKHRDWLTGFDGSAGSALVLANDKTILYADGRYFIQADEQVPLSHVQVAKMGQPGHPTLMESLSDLPKGATLALDPKTVTARQFEAFESLHLTIVCVDHNPIEILRKDEHEGADVVIAPWRVVDASFHGRSTADKLVWLRKELVAQGAGAAVLSDLADIAWLTNTRGRDIPYNPVFTSFMWIDAEHAVLFATPPEDDQTVKALLELQKQSITLKPYKDFKRFLDETTHGVAVRVNKAKHSQAVYQWLDQAGAVINEGSDLVYNEKFKKTPEELAGMRAANLRSSVAVIRTLAWLDAQAASGAKVSEVNLAHKIEQCYEQEGCLDLSFNTIAGIGVNTAKIHYGTPSDEGIAKKGDWILLDSGAQYSFGTTDITRTTTFGKYAPTEEHRHAYTHVLKAVIACSGAVFPKGASGAQLDGICRGPLWQAGYDYGHGTGHGVGSFLNVHEGPNGISKGYANVIEPNTVNSIEPGYYAEGWGGIRLENLAEVVEANIPLAKGTPQRTWYRFEPLNLIPFAKHLIDLELLSPSERAWLDNYYAQIIERISPRLKEKDTSALAWLKEMCAL